MGTRYEIAEFLKSRRSRLRPDSVGLPVGRRRSPGLRRSEVADLAGISVDYYVRLEQGRSLHPSPSVLNGLAQALRLTADERDYLYRLLPGARPAAPPSDERPDISRHTRNLLDAMGIMPGFVINRSMDVVAWNAQAEALLGDLITTSAARPNLLWHLFCEPSARTLYVEWERAARQGVARLRACAARHPDAADITAMVHELSARSEQFRTWWAEHDVEDCSNGVKVFDHPVAGRLTLEWEVMTLPGGHDHYLVTYSAPPGSTTESALTLLAVTRTPPVAQVH
jgi:transcriptional regulator with XRE-family HTH domain